MNYKQLTNFTINRHKYVQKIPKGLTYKEIKYVTAFRVNLKEENVKHILTEKLSYSKKKK